MKTWSNTQIQNHIEAAEKLSLIKDEVALFIKLKKEIYEKDVVDFVKKSYKKQGLINDDKKEFGIVAFGINTKEVHYFPKGKGLKLKPNTLILLDIWARLNKTNSLPIHKSQRNLKLNETNKSKDFCLGPYADMTWMFYFGNKIPNEIQNKWKILSQSRDMALEYIEKEIFENKYPRGLDVDRISHDVIGGAGFGESIRHTIGHSLGFKSPHGDLPGINWREYSPILKNVGYTIEPGMYFAKFGMRTEIDFYISEENKVIITTPIQKEIETIS